MGEQTFFVYILSSISGTLYVGVTDNLEYRLWQHQNGVYDGFTKAHKVNRLMYYETYRVQKRADARGKQIKGYRRAKKIALFEKTTPSWRDLTPEVFPKL